MRYGLEHLALGHRLWHHSASHLRRRHIFLWRDDIGRRAIVDLSHLLKLGVRVHHRIGRARHYMRPNKLLLLLHVVNLAHCLVILSLSEDSCLIRGLVDSDLLQVLLPLMLSVVREVSHLRHLCRHLLGCQIRILVLNIDLQVDDSVSIFGWEAERR